MKRPAFNTLTAFMTVFFLSPVLSPVQGGSADREAIVATAKEYLGRDYNYGDTGSQGFDCSGFTMHVYGRNGITLPRTSSAQFTGGKEISLAQARPGDLVFFYIQWKRISHVGIYLGDGTFIHSPRTGKKVQISSMEISYWKERFAGAATYFDDGPH